MKHIKLETKNYTTGIKFILISAFLFSFCFLIESKNSISYPDQDKDTKWIPYTLPWDDMPIDLSYIYKNDIPYPVGYERVAGMGKN